MYGNAIMKPFTMHNLIYCNFKRKTKEITPRIEEFPPPGNYHVYPTSLCRTGIPEDLLKIQTIEQTSQSY
jgi:hypothetical protein